MREGIEGGPADNLDLVRRDAELEQPNAHLLLRICRSRGRLFNPLQYLQYARESRLQRRDASTSTHRCSHRGLLQRAAWRNLISFQPVSGS